jgi:uncharacterized damage-inducible protein DinB
MKFALTLAALLAAPLFASAQDKFIPDFAKHWAVAKTLTLAVANAMPAADYGFKPNPEEMSFGEQMVHIGAANFSYCSRLKGEKSPYVKPETADHDSAVKVLNAAFDYCSAAVGGLADLDTAKGPMDPREIMMGVYAHMAHHRGQAEVYLRVKGIKPPDYKF